MESSAAVGAWVLLEPDDAERTGGTVGRGGQNSQLGGSEAQAGKGRQPVPGGER